MTEQSELEAPLLAQWSAELTTRTGLPLYVRPVNTQDDKMVDGFNRAAIDLEREMGFTASPYPGDATLTLVRKSLGD